MTNTSETNTNKEVELLFDLIVSLTPAYNDKKNIIFISSSKKLLKCVLKALIELRDKHEIQLSVETIVDYLTLSKVIALAERTDFTKNTRDAIRDFLTSIGWQEGKDEKSQTKFLPEQFGYARAYIPFRYATDNLI